MSDNHKPFKFLVQNKAFQLALKPAIEVATKGVLKDLDSSHKVSLEAKSGEVIANAFGGKSAISLVISEINNLDLDYKCETEGKATVSAQALMAALDSFPVQDKLVLSFDGKELVVYRESDPDEFQAIPLVINEVVLPEPSNKVIKEFSINRSAFLHGYSKVFWAVGFEEHKEQYFYWQVTGSKSSVRFVCGTGGRFAIFDMEGDSLIKVQNKTEFLFHKEQAPVIASVLSSLTPSGLAQDDMLLIKHCERDGDAPEQIVIELPTIKLTLVGFDTTVSYPSMAKFLDPVKPYRIKTKVSDWEYAVKGLQAVWNAEAKKTHESFDSEIEPKLDDKYILLTTHVGMRSQRKVPLLEVVDKGTETSGRSYHFTTQYISEIFTKNKKDDEIEISYWEEPQKPLVVSSNQSSNSALNTTEKLTILIAPLNKG